MMNTMENENFKHIFWGSVLVVCKNGPIQSVEKCLSNFQIRMKENNYKKEFFHKNKFFYEKFL